MNHVVVSINTQASLKAGSSVGPKSIHKYVPLGLSIKSGEVLTQTKICLDDEFDQVHYLCTDAPPAKDQDIHVFEQFSEGVVSDKVVVPFRDLGIKTIKRINSASSSSSQDDSDKSKAAPAKVALDEELANNAAFVEGLYLGVYNFKTYWKSGLVFPEVSVLGTGKSTPVIERAKTVAQAELFARFLMDLPSNHKPPTKIAQRIKETFPSDGSVTVTVRDRAWIEEHKMGSFLGVTQGSDEDPALVEIFYNGNPDSKETTLQFVGKGVTFDAGGISLKPAKGMKDMRGDMGGAATSIAAMYALSQLKPKINVRSVAVFCENLPSGKAVKPGDVITAMNGKTIEVDNTDAEGRLILADALYYATSTYKPKYVVNLATLTGAIVVALGSLGTGTFVTHNSFWKKIEKAGYQTDDIMWRMPLFARETAINRMKSDLADYCNMSNKPEAGSCSAAGFLTQFVDFSEDKSSPQFAHLDIAGTAMSGSTMTGKPTRALIQLVENLAREEN